MDPSEHQSLLQEAASCQRPVENRARKTEIPDEILREQRPFGLKPVGNGEAKWKFRMKLYYLKINEINVEIPDQVSFLRGAYG